MSACRVLEFLRWIEFVSVLKDLKNGCWLRCFSFMMRNYRSYWWFRLVKNWVETMNWVVLMKHKSLRVKLPFLFLIKWNVWFCNYCLNSIFRFHFKNLLNFWRLRFCFTDWSILWLNNQRLRIWNYDRHLISRMKRWDLWSFNFDFFNFSLHVFVSEQCFLPK